MSQSKPAPARKVTIHSDAVDVRDAGDPNLQHQAGETRIRDNQIAASAENEQRQPPGASELDGFDHLGFGQRLDKKAGRPTDAKRRQGSQRNIFADQHGVENTINVAAWKGRASGRRILRSEAGSGKTEKQIPSVPVR